MRKFMTTAAALAATALAACAPEEAGTAVIEGVFPLIAPECTVKADDDVFVATNVLDIGFDAATANSLLLPLKVRTNLPSTFSTQTLSQDQQRSPNYASYGNVDTNIITFKTSEIFYTTDADRGAELALGNTGTPVNDNTARRTGVSGVAFNEQTQLLTESVVFATAITRDDAGALGLEQFISDALIDVNSRVRVIANIRLEGETTGSATVRTPPFPFAVELCRGCLVPQCPAGQSAVPANGDACLRGQNDVFVCR